MRSATGSMTTPADVVRVTRPDHSLNRPGSPSPFPQIRKLEISSVTFCLAGTELGTTVLVWLLGKPISPGNAGLTSMVTTVLTELMGTGSPEGFEASTRIVNGKWTLSQPFGQSRAGVPNRAPPKVATFVPPVTLTTATAPPA